MNQPTAQYVTLQQILRLWSCRFYHQLIAKETSLFSHLVLGSSHHFPSESARSLVSARCGVGAWSEPRHRSRSQRPDTRRHWVTAGHQSASLWSAANTGWSDQWRVCNFGSIYLPLHCLEVVTSVKNFLLKSWLCLIERNFHRCLERCINMYRVYRVAIECDG